MSTSRYYIAINGPSASMVSLPFPSPPMVVPWCQNLIGFPTLKDAQAAQRLCLTAPLTQVRAALLRWAADPRILFLITAVPPGQPKRDEPTMWMKATVEELCQVIDEPSQVRLRKFLADNA